MTNEELLDMLIDIQGRKCETQMLEIKAAEIPGIDLAERPCYYTGKGRLKGAYVRVGDSDDSHCSPSNLCCTGSRIIGRLYRAA